MKKISTGGQNDDEKDAKNSQIDQNDTPLARAELSEMRAYSHFQAHNEREASAKSIPLKIGSRLRQPGIDRRSPASISPVTPPCLASRGLLCVAIVQERQGAAGAKRLQQLSTVEHMPYSFATVSTIASPLLN